MMKDLVTDVKNSLPQIPEEIELELWIKDWSDWKGGVEIKAYLRQSLEDMLGRRIGFYKRAGEDYEYWTSPAQGAKLGELYKTGVLQDLLKILGAKRLKIKEHNRIYYHPTTSRLFGLKDQAWDNEYEISLTERDLKNKYIMRTEERKLDVYVELKK